jgi:hypothetical protein
MDKMDNYKMDNYTRSEKVEICLNIANSLKNYRGKDDTPVNLFNENYSFVPQLKKLFNEYINGHTYFRGSLDFVEIGKRIDYHLPLTRDHRPLFVIRV